MGQIAYYSNRPWNEIPHTPRHQLELGWNYFVHWEIIKETFNILFGAPKYTNTYQLYSHRYFILPIRYSSYSRSCTDGRLKCRFSPKSDTFKYICYLPSSSTGGFQCLDYDLIMQLHFHQAIHYQSPFTISSVVYFCILDSKTSLEAGIGVSNVKGRITVMKSLWRIEYSVRYVAFRHSQVATSIYWSRLWCLLTFWLKYYVLSSHYNKISQCVIMVVLTIEVSESTVNMDISISTVQVIQWDISGYSAFCFPLVASIHVSIQPMSTTIQCYHDGNSIDVVTREYTTTSTLKCRFTTWMWPFKLLHI